MKRRFIKPLLALTSLLLTLTALEVVARISGHQPEPAAATPMFSWSRSGEFWVMPVGRDWHTRRGNHPVRVNNFGLRGPDIGARKAGSPRVLFLGDSVAFGYGLAEEHTFVHLLAGRSVAGSGPLDTVNAAIAGWSARQHRMFLQRYADTLRPDVVIVAVVLNDLTELLRGDREIHDGSSFAAMNALTALAEKSAAVAAAKQAYIRLADPRGREIGSVRELAEHPDSRAVRHAMHLHLQELAEAREFATVRGIRFALLLLPFAFQLETPKMNAPQQQMRDFAAQNGIPVLDTLELLNSQPANEVMLDHAHLSIRGHAMVADAVEDWLAEPELLGNAEAFPLGESKR